MASIFTRIINGDIPCEKIAENDRFFSFLDIRPINPGHTLVIPKEETDYLFDLDDDLLGDLMIFAKPIAKALEKAVSCQRVGVVVAGLEVPHAHVHLIPFSDIGELSFDRAKPASPEDLAALADQIREELR
jgi:histidine triad (HIT) family protein